MIANDGLEYKQCNIHYTSPDTHQISYIGLTTDDPSLNHPPSPFSIRYYTQQNAVPATTSNNITTRLQVDGGANRSLTNNKHLLSKYQQTQTYNIYGVTKDEIALQCTGKGYLPWHSDNGDILYIPCYYSSDAAETIISPTDVVMAHRHLYTGWAHFAHITTGRGHVTFYRLDGTNHTTNSLKMTNGLRYHESSQPSFNSDGTPTSPTDTQHAVVHRLSSQARYELYHQRLGHCGKRKMDVLHRHIQGLQQLKGNAFHLCQSCIYRKQIQRAMKAAHHRVQATTPTDKEIDWFDLYSPVDNIDTLQPREMFHMDFGFP